MPIESRFVDDQQFIDELYAEDLKTCETMSIKFCNTCQVKIDIDDKNAYVGMLNVDETVTCYHCFYKVDDEKQVAKDNQDAKDKGFVELPNGKWVKKGKVRKDNLTHK
jgi:hypothetical protein